MFNIIYRRLQKYSLLIKLFLLVISGTSLGLLIYYTTPLLTYVLIAVILAWIFLLTMMSFLINIRGALILATGVGFLLFLKAVDLLTVINLILLITFLVLLGFYFKNPKAEKNASEPKSELPQKVLFPKGWPFRVAKKGKQE